MMRFVAIPLLCLGIVLFFRTSDEGAVELGQKPHVRTSASALDQEYYNDRQAADQKYRDKVLQVSGTVMRVEQDGSGQISAQPISTNPDLFYSGLARLLFCAHECELSP